MPQHSTYTAKPKTRNRTEIPEKYRWDLSAIFPDPQGWEIAFADLSKEVEKLASFRGRLNEGEGKALLEFLTLHDEVSIASYRVWYYPSLAFDTDQRDNSLDAQRQRVEELFARINTATSWYSPEVISLGLENVRSWMDANKGLALYRFALEELFRQAEHILDEKGEHLLALSSRFASTPSSTYQMLSTADVKHRLITLSDGEEVTVTPGAYRSLLTSLRNQQDREAVFRAHYELYKEKVNTYSSIYSGVLQRGWFYAQARGYDTVIESKLHGDNIPTSVVETLVENARANSGALQRYHTLRKKYLGLERYDLYDGFVPLANLDPRYGYDEVRELILASVKPFGDEYVRKMEEAFDNRWIDVYENEGKRSGAYSAGVYGIHPYMLLNYQDTLDDVFTLAHELGHTMHSLLSDENQPFVYSSYTIFVAEVASTMNEALLLEEMLRRTEDPVERVLLLEHAIEGITGTFYTQALFADFELRAHRAVEAGEPITSETLSQTYKQLLNDYYGDSVDKDDLYRVTWARIPHFYQSPYYVYQYATCYASTATILKKMRGEDPDIAAEASSKYMELLKSGGSDHPMELLKKAGVDLNDPETVRAVGRQLEELVALLESELEKLSKKS